MVGLGPHEYSFQMGFVRKGQVTSLWQKHNRGAPCVYSDSANV